MTENYTLTQKVAAEFIGTFSIVFFGAGAVAIELLTAPESAGTEFVLQGLGFGSLGWLGIAVAFLGAVGIPIYLLGHVSGQHINPAVTIGFLITRRIDAGTAAGYIGGQLAGGIAGSLAFIAIRGRETIDVAAAAATAPFPDVTVVQAVGAEAVGTFFLMFAVMAFVADDRTPDNLAGLVIGFVVAVAHLAVGNISGASLNPARTLGPYVTNSLLGGPNFWAHAAIYVVGPVAGAVAGAIAYEKIVLTPYRTPEPDVQSSPSNDPAD
jgi:glycerol uptake facilitator protein